MYEPTDREIALATCRALNKIDEKLNWLIGAAFSVVLILLFKV